MAKVRRSGKLARLIKRGVDLLVASLSLVLLSPLIIIIAVAVKLSSPGPVFFRQARLGKGGVSFKLYKFRTMHDKVQMVLSADGSAFVGKRDARLTRLGRFLRDYTLDEIPQLFNVLKGEMSVIGPRPDLVEQLQVYDEMMSRKLEVKPGMACLSLVSGRNSLPWRERAALDVYYVDHRSFKLDAEIFFKGCVLVLQRRGVYYPETSARLGTNHTEHRAKH
jgi:undecaprenyl phosphate N,N'-diacetylbacillosamine 1-phosphate transferase